MVFGHKLIISKSLSWDFINLLGGRSVFKKINRKTLIKILLSLDPFKWFDLKIYNKLMVGAFVLRTGFAGFVSVGIIR